MTNNRLEKTYEIEKMLKKDARQQKSIGSGVFHRASRRGYIKGGIKTPYDYMSTKERKKLNGEVKVYMIYEQGIEYVKPINEIMEMPNDERLTYFNNIMNLYKVRELCSKWKISTSTLYNNYIPKIGYVKNSETALKKAGRKKKEQNTTTTDTQTKTNDIVNNTDNKVVKQNSIVATPNNDNTTVDNNLSEVNSNIVNKTNENFNDNKDCFEQEFKLKGRYTAASIDNIYNKIKILLDQGLLYDIEINVKESNISI